MNIPLDKQAHALTGSNVSTVVGFTTLLFWLTHFGTLDLSGTLLAMFLGTVAGSGLNRAKEEWDKHHPATNTYDMGDFYAGTIGAVIGSLVVGAVAFVVRIFY